MRPRDPALAVIALSALVVLALTGCITDTEPSRPVETATVSVEASPTTSDTGEPDEVLVSRDDLTFTAGTYSSLSEWPDILRQGTLRADSDDCLVLEDQSGIHPVLFPRGTFVEHDGTIHVPGEFVVRPVGWEDEHGQPLQYRVGSTISGGGP